MLTFTATGDSFITRRLPSEDAAARELGALIRSAQVRFTNLETVLRRDEGFPAAQSGGTWATSPPEVLHDLQTYGFNLVAWANNHTLDYSYGGLEATQKYLEQYGFLHAGAGRNLAEASAVRYLDCAGGRVALIAATATFHESWSAGEQRRDGIGRPGVNPLRFTRKYRVGAAELAQLEAIAAQTGLNAERELSQKEGFLAPDAPGTLRFGGQIFEATEGESGESTEADARDVQRIARSIDEAGQQADCVLVSIHAHEMREGRKELPAQFLVEFARACIDAGAHAIIGHGPHILRGLEIYKNRPIFYSLGNFIFQNDTVARLPADFYEKYGLHNEHHVAEALSKRSAGDTRGLGTNPKVWHSVVPRWEMKNGELTALELFPIALGFGEPPYRRGWPRLTEESTALEELQQLSRPFGTELQIKKGRAEVLLG